MTTLDVGIRSLGVKFPSRLRTNDYYRTKYPDLVRAAEEKSLARAFLPDKKDLDKGEKAWLEAMAPYLTDPFRGTVERRVLGPGETSLTLEEGAAREALGALGMTAADVDCLIVASQFQEHPGPPNAAFLANMLGFTGAAWSISAMCGSVIVALEQARALVRAGQYRNVLVVVSCTYSRLIDETDTFGWFFGDGAAAFVVGPVAVGHGTLHTKVQAMPDTCGMFYLDLDHRQARSLHGVVRASNGTGNRAPAIFARYAERCCHSVLSQANVRPGELDLVVPYTATAWYAPFMARLLEIDPERVPNTHALWGNISIPSVPANLYHAASHGRLRQGDLVLLYSHGFSGSAGAALLRWGDVALGAPPPPSSSLELDEP